MEARLTIEQGYRTMLAFLESYLDDTNSREVASWMWEFRLGRGGEPGDPGTWGAWLEAVGHVVGNQRTTMSQHEAFAIARQFLAAFAAETSSAEFRNIADAMAEWYDTREWRRWLEAARGV